MFSYEPLFGKIVLFSIYPLNDELFRLDLYLIYYLLFDIIPVEVRFPIKSLFIINTRDRGQMMVLLREINNN